MKDLILGVLLYLVVSGIHIHGEANLLSFKIMILGILPRWYLWRFYM